MIQKSKGFWLERVPGQGWNFTQWKEDRASSFQVSHAFHWRLCIPDSRAQHKSSGYHFPTRHCNVGEKPKLDAQRVGSACLIPHPCFLLSERLNSGPLGSWAPCWLRTDLLQ